MQMSRDDAHIALFGQEECELLIELVDEFLAEEKTDIDIEYLELVK